MDNFLSGRERIGGVPKPKDEAQLLPPGALQKLQGEPDPEKTVSSECEGDGGSKVQYVSQDGQVVKIVVTCACGQVTEIDCRYEEE